MKRRMTTLTAISLLFLLVIPVFSLAQGKLEDYRRADSLNAKLRGLVFNSVDRINWIDSGKCWYVKILKDGREFILVDPEKGIKAPAFDHEKLAVSLSKAAGKTYSGKNLPFNAITFVNKETAIQFNVENYQWECNLKTYQCTRKGAVTQPARGGQLPPTPLAGLR